jgi:hypothetical protein
MQVLGGAAPARHPETVGPVPAAPADHRGPYHQPAAITDLPPVIYVATSAVGDYRAGGEVLAGHDVRRPEWILRDGLVT